MFQYFKIQFENLFLLIYFVIFLKYAEFLYKIEISNSLFESISCENIFKVSVVKNMHIFCGFITNINLFYKEIFLELIAIYLKNFNFLQK